MSSLEKLNTFTISKLNIYAGTERIRLWIEIRCWPFTDVRFNNMVDTASVVSVVKLTT